MPETSAGCLPFAAAWTASSFPFCRCLVFRFWDIAFTSILRAYQFLARAPRNLQGAAISLVQHRELPSPLSCPFPCLSAFRGARALVSLVVEKDRKSDWRGRHRPVWLLVATRGVCVMRKVHLNVGTIGHIDHGKTTLTAASQGIGRGQELSGHRQGRHGA